MTDETYTVELTIQQIGMIQRALRLAAGQADTNYGDGGTLDLEHLRTHIAQSVTNKEEQ